MPTLNPRITVTLTPAVAAVMRQMSQLTGNSQSAMIGELLEEARPVFERMVKVLQAAKDVKTQVRDDLVSSLESIQQRLEHQFGLGLELIDDGSAPLLEKAEEIRRRQGRAGGAAQRPAVPASGGAGASTPMSNRGVTPRTGKGKPVQKGRGAKVPKRGHRARP
jgi:hypothetical protein